MTKKAQKIDVFAKSVEKRKKSQHVGKSDRRSNDNLSRGMYLPLDRRPIRVKSVLSRLLTSQRGPCGGLDYEMNDLPCDDFQKMYMT
jgi:hypothetical protein